ncbi:MAG: S8 family serine peptidase [Acidobacteria bacterium]|nr:S8 family serine peptidase [Acidobacteriota bacterium]
MSEAKRYILLPAEGFVSEQMRQLSSGKHEQGGRVSLSTMAKKQLPSVAGVDDIHVVDSAAADAPKVVTVPPETARSLRKSPTAYILAPIRTYRPAIRPVTSVRVKNLYTGFSERTSIKISVHDASNDLPLPGVAIVAVLDSITMKGLSRRTGQSGQVTLTFPGTSKRIARLYVYPPHGYWGRFAENVILSDGYRISLNRIDLNTADILRHIYPKRSRNQGKGVRVAVVDSGIDSGHSDLKVSGGANVTDDGKSESEHGPVSDHGTHVAGIIAGRGKQGTGIRGLAPEAELYSYRVFAEGSKTTDTAFIMKAIYRAVQDGCDLINLSLGGGLSDLTLSRAIGYAFENGVLCIAAAGNNRRKEVSYPAWYKRSIAVSALGKKGSFPDDSIDAAEILDPYSTNDGSLFIAAFSNIGYEIDFTGPGVAVVSTVPNNGYAVESGTSMACPAVTAVIAGLLSDNPKILRAEPNLKRTLAIVELVRSAAVAQGFNQRFEGLGLLQF